MFGFVMGVVVGAAGYWGYRLWKGDDTSWDQSWSAPGNESVGQNSDAGSAVRGGAMPSSMSGSSSGTSTPGGPTSAEGGRPMPE